MKTGKEKGAHNGAPIKRISLTANAIMWIAVSLAVNVILEVLQRRSLISTLSFMFTRGHLFLIGTAIILLCTSPMLIVKRKLFACAIPAVLWIAVGVTNTICLSYRPLPISFSDFRLAGEALQMLDLYMRPWQILVIAVCLLAVIFALVALFVKGPRFDCGIKRSLFVFVPAFVILAVFVTILGIFNFFPRGNETPNEFYEKNGFAYNFFKSAGSTGVYTPGGYTADEAEMLKKELDELDVELSSERPNIIVLQLESFFDITTMHSVSLTEDPIPNFRRLKEGASGYLFVPSYGGGTSNVEFEVLTGMNLDHFSIGESPYYTLLKKTVLDDAAPFNMKRLGYSAHAIHNHGALFYERPNAYNNMGFDTFTSLEYMNDVTYNSQTWAHDDVLTKEILSALDSTEGEDFVFTVSVQGHGPYPESVDPSEFENYIEASADNLTPAASAGLSYYASTLWEMDKMVGELVQALEARDEKCVLVVYGDHLPALDFSVNYISAPNAYTSQYVVWSNYGLELEDRDLEAYQLLSYVQGELGLSVGYLARYHFYYSENEDYQDRLKVLEVAMTKNEDGVRKDPIVYSCHPVIVKSVSENGGDIVVKGENFTPFSKIAVNGEMIDTLFESPTLLLANADALARGGEITVVQLSRDGSTVLENVSKLK